MLAWPALSLLKKQYPESIVTVLIPSYTKPIAETCPWIDNIIALPTREPAMLTLLGRGVRNRLWLEDADL